MKDNLSRLLALPLLLPALVAFQAPESGAALTIYTGRAAFLTDAASLGIQTLDFEALPAGTTIADPTAVGGITFSGFGTPLLIVDDDFEATSGVNYLGMDNAGTFNQFSYADGFDMGFASGNAIGLNIITAEVPGLTLFDDDIRIDVPGIGVASIDADTVDAMTPGGDRIYFIGLIDTVNTFATAQLRGSGGLGFYNVDDITVAVIPEPSVSLAMAAFAPVLLAACWWRRSSKRKSNGPISEELK